MTLVVRADVVELKRDKPRAGDVFLVDTNVWYFLTYTRATGAPHPPRTYQTRDYPSYIERVLDLAQKSEAKLHYSPLSYSELAHLIERCEWQIYCTANATDVPLKEFRRDPAARASVMQEVKDAWGQVLTMSTCLPVTLDAGAVVAAHAELVSAEVDAYDAHMVASAKASGVLQIISDDSDLSSVPGVKLFTSVSLAISEARLAKRLLSRPPVARPAVQSQRPPNG